MLKWMFRLVSALFMAFGLILVLAVLFVHVAVLNLTATQATDVFLGSTMIGIGVFLEARVK